ncbi:MAG TPA: family 78 glycoside hydrolase catalytic domain [Candidatus Limnocylindrales bacterium]|nr:family 78 glycoside hydrolase catalytic domain [Candidatus Limnocylindrales bacterium]
MATVVLVQGLYAGISPVGLSCGSWQNPLGIDDPNPRLSWQVTATIPGERAQTETAYQIQVASSVALLASNQPDLWDSGKVVSAQPFNVPYAGSALASAQQVFWQVRVWDKNNQPSLWSPMAAWTMGLLNQADWQGGWLVSPSNILGFSLSGCSWIWYPEGNPASSAPVATRYFRKTISVRSDSTLTNATLLLTADNSYTAYVNGTQVGQGQDYTVAIPSTNLAAQFQPGNNTLAIAAVNGGSAANPAGLIGKLILSYTDGAQTNIQMGATWKAKNSLQSGWQSPAFNDSSWANALVLGSFGISPWGTGVSVQNAQTGLPIFRRQFTVGPGLERAVIYICGLGQYELSANGAKVGDALMAPGWTKYNKTCLYDTLDLTSYLTNGNNTVGVMLGNGMYNVPASSRYTKFTGSFGPPKVIAQIYLYYTNGTSQVIASDAQWLTTSGPITFSSIYGGEDYDARLSPAGWNQSGFNSSAWSAAVVTNGAGGILRGQSHAAPPIVATQTLPPVKTNTISSSTFVYDLGQNAALIPSLTTHGQAGATVQITPAELTNSDGTVNRGSVGGGAAYWKYTLAGTGSETWVPKFFYHGSRYLQVTLTAASGSAQLPVVDALTGVVIQSGSTNVGDFSCSNDLFNRTRRLIRWAQRNNLISLLTDCPHRERLGWLEQYNLHGPSLRYEFDVGQLFSKTMQDMADSQTAAGLQPDIAPEYVVFGGGFRDSPEWGSSVIIVPWQHYLFTGDDAVMRNYYSVMTNYFGYLKNQAVSNFLNYPSGLGDWYDIGPGAPGYSQLTPVSLTADAYYFQDAQILAQVAARLGKTSEAIQFNALATDIATAFNNTYYSATNGYYATGSQTAQSMPLALGMVDSNQLASVTAALVANVYSQGLTAGDIGHRYLLRALADMDRSDVVFDLHGGTNNPGYGYILNQGATALTEAWDANPSSSQDHFMLGHITEWFYHDLAGIQPDPAAPGFQHVIVKPAFVGGITWVNASYDSVRGTIVSDWTFTNNQATLNVTIPVGSSGSIYLPLLGAVTTNLLIKESGTTIWQNGTLSGSAMGVAFDHVQGAGSQTYMLWTVGSGSYQFAWNVFSAPTGLKAAAGSGQVTLSWNSGPGVTGYNVKRSTTSGNGYTTVASGVAGTNYTDAGLANNIIYYYVVSAMNGGTESANSSEVNATPGNLSNFGFETPGVGTYQYNPSGGSWSFTAPSGANGSGLAANNSAFTSANPPAPQGVQVAFLQGLATVSQLIGGLVPGASYAVSFAAAQRNYQQNGGQTWNVTLDGTAIGSFAPPRSATSYADYTAYFTATAPTHLLAFVGTDANSGDNTVFIDNVRLALSPSLIPPHLAWQVAVGQVQFVWPSDHTGWELQVQTNSLNFGLGTNWVTMAGSNLTNQYIFPLDLAYGSVFFRLAYP